MRLEDLKSSQLSRIEDLKFRAGGCEDCSLNTNRKVPIVGVGSINPDVVMVVDRSSVQASLCGNIFAGKEGSILNSIIRLAEIDPSILWVTPCVYCPTERSSPGERPKEVFSAPKKRAITSCRPRLHEEIRILEPNMLIAMGPTSVEALRGQATFTQSRGRIVEASIEGEVVDFKLPMMVIDSVMTLLRHAQNPSKIWNKNIAYIRLATEISEKLKEI